MRFYDIKLSNAAGQVYKPMANGNGFTLASGGTTFTSFVNGQSIPGALNVEFDFPASPWNTPQGNNSIKVHGVGLGMIGQAADLNGANISLSAGMKPGLPLATAQAPQAGVIAQGMVFQAFGNWQGTDQSLDLIFNASLATADQQISFNWPAGTPVAQALATVFTQAFPSYQQNIAIGNLVLPNTEAGYYRAVWQFGGYLTDLTQKIGAALYGPNYPGVQIIVVGNQIRAFDGTSAATPKQLAFHDLIGQPTWYKPLTLHFQTVLRSDIAVGDLVQFPQGIFPPAVLSTPAAAMGPNTPPNWKSIFQGSFLVNDVHYWGNYRQPDGASWTNAFTASPINLSPIT